DAGGFGIRAGRDGTTDSQDRVRDYAGLATTRPALAALMTAFLLGLGGFRAMAGFVAKWYVFSAAVKAGNNGLAIIGVLTSVVSVFFYLRIVVMMYMTPGDRTTQVPALPRMAGLALAASAILVVYLASRPPRVLDWPPPPA